MPININNKYNFARQRGLSLIELMIAIPLGLLLMFAVLQVFSGSVQGVNLQHAFARVQENGRMSIELMIRDIRGAGFWGCYRGDTAINNLLDTEDENYDDSLLPDDQATVAGENNVSANTSIAGITVKEGSDTLTLRGAKSFSEIKLDPDKLMNTKSAIIHIVKGIGKEEVIKEGDILLIGDCTAADMFTNTKADPFQSGIIGRNTGTINVAGAVKNKSKELTKTYGLSAQILTPYVKNYFIGENSAGGYSLYRSEEGTASELVRGVSDLQLLYGEDTTANGSVDTFSDASAVSDMDNVRAIRVQLVSESGDASSAPLLARTYTVTVNIRNRTLQ